MPSQSIAFIYKSLGCLHSLQPSPAEEKDGYSSPSVPALKPRGFVTWQTIQILLGPEEHVPFIQTALMEFRVVDPVTGLPFPKVLPKEAFPSKPDQHMIEWHEGVSDRLRIEAEDASERMALATRDARQHQSNNDDAVSISSTDERADAVRYFSNPQYRTKDGRPAIVRSFERAGPLVKQSGKAVALTVRNIASPYLWSNSSDKERDGRKDGRREDDKERIRRRSRDKRYDHDSPDGAQTPSGNRPTSSRAPSYRRYPSSHSHTAPHPDHNHQYPLPPRRSTRHRSPSTSPSDSDDARPRRRRPTSQSHSPNRRTPRRHKSHEPASSPREYFGHWDRPVRPHHSSDRSPSGSGRLHPSETRHASSGSGRRYSDDRAYSDDSPQRPMSGYFPSESPPFAARVARNQAQHASTAGGSAGRDRSHRRSIPHIASPLGPGPSNGPSSGSGASSGAGVGTAPPTAPAPTASPPPRGHPDVRSPRARPISGGPGVKFTDPFTGKESAPRRGSPAAPSSGSASGSGLGASSSGLGASGLAAATTYAPSPGSSPLPVPAPVQMPTSPPSIATASMNSALGSPPNQPLPPLQTQTQIPTMAMPMPDQRDGVAEPNTRSREEPSSERRPLPQRLVTPVGGVGGRRYPNESIWR